MLNNLFDNKLNAGSLLMSSNYKVSEEGSFENHLNNW